MVILYDDPMQYESLFHVALAAVAIFGAVKLGGNGRRALFGLIGTVKIIQELYVLTLSLILGRSLEHAGETVVWLTVGSVLLAYALRKPQPQPEPEPVEITKE